MDKLKDILAKIIISISILGIICFFGYMIVDLVQIAGLYRFLKISGIVTIVYSSFLWAIFRIN